MTEAEWFACRDPQSAINSFGVDLVAACGAGRLDRGLRLFAVACCRRAGHLCRSAKFCEAVEMAERGADGRRNEDRKHLKHARRNLNRDRPWLFLDEGRLSLAVVGRNGRIAGNYSSHWAASVIAGGDPTAHEQEKVEQAIILRDIVGNPFRPVRFLPAWRTSSAVHLAHGMYESRDFAAMPILADALQEAGCDNDDVLNHCRGASGVHVCGCWVVDGVLGKS